MPTKVIQARLVPRSFHWELIRVMQAAGYIRLYQFTATTDSDTYHVPCQYAQETSHFFYLPDHGFLVQLALSEVVYEDGTYLSWWSGAVYLQLYTDAMLEYEIVNLCPQHEGSRFASDGCQPLDHIMENLGTVLAPFRSVSSSRAFDHDADAYGWRLEYSGSFRVDELVSFVDHLRTHFGPFLKPTLSRDLNVFGFVGHSWSGIRERFWRGFPTQLLKELVPGRILGRELQRSVAHR